MNVLFIMAMLDLRTRKIFKTSVIKKKIVKKGKQRDREIYINPSKAQK